MIPLNELRLFAAAAAVRDDCVAIRRELHQYAALSGEEVPTIRRIGAFLDAHRIPYTTCLDGCGIVVTIGTRREPAIGIRADIDALPVTEETGLPFASLNTGVMHACGHDIHTAILLGTACVLKGMEPNLSGTVKLFFQPREETTGGALPMIEAGCMDGPCVSRVFALHVDPTIPVGKAAFLAGPMNAAVTDLAIEITGASCHGAHPEGGVDAILAAAHVLVALQSVVSRNLAPTDAGVMTVGTLHGGTAENIVAGQVRMTGTLRALDPDTMHVLKKRVTEVAKATAQAYGATATVTLTDSYPVLINDDAVTDRLMAVATAVLGNENMLRMKQPSLGADDFAFFTSVAPGCYFNLGCAAPDDPAPAPLHSPRFCPDEGCIQTGVLLEVAGALTLLED